MNQFVVLIGVMSILIGNSSARPGHLLFSYPAASQQTTVLRDALGNQATAYSYQDGHSSSVALSRNDVSKHLSYVPVAAAAPVIYEQPVLAAAPYHYASPAAYHVPDNYYGSYYY